jgi:hypothetical protein
MGGAAAAEGARSVGGDGDGDETVWLAALRRLKEDCEFDAARQSITEGPFNGTLRGELELALLELDTHEVETALSRPSPRAPARPAAG